MEAIRVESEKAVVDQESCIDCGTCIGGCSEKAISRQIKGEKTLKDAGRFLSVS